MDNDQAGQVRAVLAAVQSHLVYVRDPINAEYVISPVRLIETINQRGVAQGDCDDHVMLFNSALGSLGFVTKFVGVKFPPGKATDFNHVISGVGYQGRLYLIDPCAKDGEQPDYQETLII